MVRKTVDGLNRPWVRIPPLPPELVLNMKSQVVSLASFKGTPLIRVNDNGVIDTRILVDYNEHGWTLKSRNGEIEFIPESAIKQFEIVATIEFTTK